MSYVSTGKIVKNKKTRDIGFTVSDRFRLASSTEAMVNFEGSTTEVSIDFKDLEIIHPEMPNPDPDKCGMGKGEECCIFLTVAQNGFRCERFTGSRRSIINRKHEMGAQRHPVEMYPDCQLK